MARTGFPSMAGRYRPERIQGVSTGFGTARGGLGLPRIETVARIRHSPRTDRHREENPMTKNFLFRSVLFASAVLVGACASQPPAQPLLEKKFQRTAANFQQVQRDG